MNINFHYFVVKTLAVKAGLTEEEAQTAAFFSEFVDDMILNQVMEGEVYNKLSRVIVKDLNKGSLYKELASKGMAGPAGEWVTTKAGSEENYSFLIPSITAFTYTEALDEDHQFESVIPFHFYPKKYRKDPTQEQRVDLRTSPAVQGSELFEEIERVVTSLAGLQDPINREIELVKFGVLLHIYADTYAHAGFSGSKGGENNVKLISNESGGMAKFTSMFGDGVAYGHGLIYHLPDLCNARYSYKMKNISGKFDDNIIERNNKEYFKPCAEQIYKWCYKMKHRMMPEDSAAEECVNQIMEIAAKVPEEYDELSKFNRLAGIWKQPNAYKDIIYEYDIPKTLGIEEISEKTKSGKPIYQIKNPNLLLAFTKATYDIRVKVMGKY